MWMEWNGWNFVSAAASILFIPQGIPFYFVSETAPMEYGDPFGANGPGVMFGH
jgi:hypothetical protein